MAIGIISIEDNPGASREVTDSLTNLGFAVLTNHGISTTSIDELYDAWAGFFKAQSRFAYKAQADSQNGYFGADQAETALGFSLPDLKEYFQYRPACRMPEELRPATDKYFKELMQLGSQVLAWLQQETNPDLWEGLDGKLGDCLASNQTMARILYYPPLSGNEATGSMRAAPHEDINFITLLPAATAGGLQIKPRGNNWIDVDAPKGALIVNIGDMLQELTGGALPSTTHRVTNPVGEASRLPRITAPVFCHPDNTMKLSTRYTAGEYLNERLSEINPVDLRPVADKGTKNDGL